MVDVPGAHLARRLLRPAELERHLLVGGDLGDVADGAPAVVRVRAGARPGGGLQPQAQLVARHQAGLVVLLREVEVRDALLVETNVPADNDVLLRLRLLHLPIVVGLHLHERREDVLVLVGVLVAQHDGLRVILEPWPRLAVEILQGRIRILLPELLQLVDLRGGDVPGPHLLLRVRDLDQPREEASVLDEGLPLSQVPVRVLQRIVGQAHAAKQNYDRVALGRDEAKKEDVALAAVIALQADLPQGAVLVQLHLLLLPSHQVEDDATAGQAGQPAVAEPLVVPSALHDASRVMDAAVPACIIREALRVEGVLEVICHVIEVVEPELRRRLV
mmetsp:Transcript_100099/g.215926  ORF Transcript_100099/g.215926 Transcript_100099/m.215926 type:complete len:332 (-) Transcript_100099:17-1012(-)